MMLNVDLKALENWLLHSDDAEELGGGEYTLDLYDVDMPLSLDIQLGKKGVELLAALELLYDEEMDGWYLGERIEDMALVEKMLEQAIAPQ